MIRLKPLLETVLSERVSDVVYHATNGHNFKSILKSDTFNLNTFGYDIDKMWAEENNLLDYYYMSVASSLSSDFIGFTKGKTVVLRLDGRKLSNNFKAFPFDYGSEGNRRGLNVSYVGDEMEDRILSKKRIIPNFSKYITGVYIPKIYIELAFNNPNEFRETIEKLIGLGIDVYICPESRIPTFSSKCKVNIDNVDELIKEIW